jgi:general secretion pathway protein G
MIQRSHFSYPSKRQFQERGFTLIELMVVIVIIGVLATLVAPRVLGRADEARVTKAKQDIATLTGALKMYRLDNQRYPTTEQGLQALVAKPTVDPVPGNWKPYIDKLPMDPWGKPYQMLSPGQRGEVDVFSFGADGRNGGESFDADIGNWSN